MLPIFLVAERDATACAAESCRVGALVGLGLGLGLDLGGLGGLGAEWAAERLLRRTLFCRAAACACVECTEWECMGAKLQNWKAEDAEEVMVVAKKIGCKEISSPYYK